MLWRLRVLIKIRRLAFLTGALRGPAESLYAQWWTVTYVLPLLLSRNTR